MAEPADGTSCQTEVIDVTEEDKALAEAAKLEANEHFKSATSMGLDYDLLYDCSRHNEQLLQVASSSQTSATLQPCWDTRKQSN